jgi:hypothetical protein
MFSRFFKSHLLAILAFSLLSGCASTRPVSRSAPIDAQNEPPATKAPLKLEVPPPQEVASSPPAPESIQVLGGVKKPGNVPYRAGADLAFYVSEAGGSSTDSDTEKVQIIRGEAGKKKAQEFNLSKGSLPSVHSGDIVIVHPAKKTFLEKSYAVAASAAAILGTAALLILMV